MMNTPARTAQILILEDDPHLLELLSETFEDVGHQVWPASSPDQALELFRKNQVELVISDIRMAGNCDGLGVLDVLKRAKPSLRCIVMTGYASDESPLRAMRINVDDYIYKPFRLPVMLDVVQKTLNRQGARESLWQQFADVVWKVPRQLRKIVEDSRQTSLRQALMEERERVLNAYFIGIRSKQLHPSRALSIWDELARVEFDYLDKFEQMDATALQELGKAYRSCYNKALVSTKIENQTTPATSSTIDRNCFFRLYDEIQKGKITSEYLPIAFQMIRLQDTSCLHGEFKRLYQILRERV